jgi:hypothetical protein
MFEVGWIGKGHGNGFAAVSGADIVSCEDINSRSAFKLSSLGSLSKLQSLTVRLRDLSRFKKTQEGSI